MSGSLAELLTLPILRASDYIIHADEFQLERNVRWASRAEDFDPAGTDGDEIVLSDIGALPPGAELVRTVTTYADLRVTALFVTGTGDHHGEPRVDDLISACGDARLALILAAKPVALRAAVRELCTSAARMQYHDLERVESLARQLIDLGIAGASVETIVSRVAELTHSPVVLEDLAHRVLAYTCEPGSEMTLLGDWETRSRLAGDTQPAQRVGPDLWTVAMVGPKRTSWARLICTASEERDSGTRAIVEAGARALTIGAIPRQHAGSRPNAHKALIKDLLLGAIGRSDEAAVRAVAIGLPTDLPGYAGVGIQIAPGSASAERIEELSERVIHLARREGLCCITATPQVHQVLALVGIPRGVNLHKAVTSIAQALQFDTREPDNRICVGLGEQVHQIGDATLSLTNARRSAELGFYVRRTHPDPFFQIHEVRLRGLTSRLRHDRRALAFAEAEIGQLLTYDLKNGTDLLGLLREYLDAGRNMTVLGRRTKLSRPTLYDRISRIERILGLSLDAQETVVSLYLALLVSEVAQGPEFATDSDQWDVEFGAAH